MGDRSAYHTAAMASYALALGAVPPVAGKDCITAVCTPVQLAAYDLRAWYDSAMIALPVGSDGAQPRVGITYTAGATAADPARLVITTGWKEPGSTDELSTSLEVVQMGSTP